MPPSEPRETEFRLPAAWGEAPDPTLSRRARRAAEQAAATAAALGSAAEAPRAEAFGAGERFAEQRAAEAREAERRAAEEFAASQRAEAERRAAEEFAVAQRAEAERLAAEDLARQRAEAERRAAEELAAWRAEAERRAEAEYEAAQRAEAERLAAEQRAAAARAEAERHAEAEYLALQRAEAERRAAAELAAATQAEAERREAERLEAERAAAERLEAERAEAERRAAKRAEAERFRAARAAWTEQYAAVDPVPPAAVDSVPAAAETPAVRGIGNPVLPGVDELWAAFTEEAPNSYSSADEPEEPAPATRPGDRIPAEPPAETGEDADELWNLFGGRGQEDIEPPVRRRSYEEPPAEASGTPPVAPQIDPAVAGSGWSLGDLEPADDAHEPGSEAFFEWGLRPDPESADPRAVGDDADPWNDPWQRDRLEQEPLGSFTAAISVQPDEHTGQRSVLDRLPGHEDPEADDRFRAGADVLDDDDDDNPFAALFAPTGPTPLVLGAGVAEPAAVGRGIDPFAGLADAEDRDRADRYGPDDRAGRAGSDGHHGGDRYGRDDRFARDDRGRDDGFGRDDRGRDALGRGGSGGSASGPSGHGGGAGDEGGASVVQVLVWVAVGLVALLILVLLYFFGGRMFSHGDTGASPAPETTSGQSASPEPTAPQPAGASYRWDQLFGGECLDPFGSPWDEQFTVVDCGQPHAAQLVYRGTIAAEDGAPFPGEETLMQQAGTGCGADGVVDVNAAAGIPDLQWQSTYPVTAEQWDAGVRSFYCFVNRSGGEPITGSLAGPGPAA